MQTENVLDIHRICATMASRTCLSLTDRAVKRVKEFLVREGYKTCMLRVSLVRTDCMGGRGYAYKLAVEESPTERDVVQDAQGLRIVVKSDDLPRLEGTIIDYEEGLERSRFFVRNPQAVGRCPCGHHDLFD